MKGEMKRITVLLGGHLREEVEKRSMEMELPLPDPPAVEELIRGLGIQASRVKLILVNGRGATSSSFLEPGDRIALFPPELSFNTFVSLSFREERVRARGQKVAKEKGNAQD